MAGQLKGSFLHDGSQFLFNPQQRSTFRNLKSLVPSTASATAPENNLSFDSLRVWRPISGLDASGNRAGNITLRPPDDGDNIKTVQWQGERVSNENFENWLARSQKHGNSTFM